MLVWALGWVEIAERIEPLANRVRASTIQAVRGDDDWQDRHGQNLWMGHAQKLAMADHVTFREATRVAAEDCKRNVPRLLKENKTLRAASYRG